MSTSRGVRGISHTHFYDDFSIGFWICSDNMVFKKKYYQPPPKNPLEVRALGIILMSQGVKGVILRMLCIKISAHDTWPKLRSTLKDWKAKVIKSFEFRNTKALKQDIQSFIYKTSYIFHFYIYS